MPTPQGFPNLDTPISDEGGTLSLTWFRFFISLWNRTGASQGNNSANFLYPVTSGNSGQVLTSQGPAISTIWTNVATKLSQLANDVGFITPAALTGFSTPNTVSGQIATANLQTLSTQIPPPDTATGQVGVSTHTARADHSHPRETDPTYRSVTTSKLVIGTPTITSGLGAPSGIQPNSSMYMRSDGGSGTRIYVSNGASWSPITGV